MMRQSRRFLQTLATVTPLLSGSTAAAGTNSVSSSLSSMAACSSSWTTRAVPLKSKLQGLSFLQGRALSVRGGAAAADDAQDAPAYETLAQPAPGSPFHYAFPVHDLELARDFYGRILGCAEGRSSAEWTDYSLHGHQIVAHWVGNDYRCIDYFNPVDGDEVPVPHTGLALTVEQFHDLAQRVRDAGVEFIIEPHLRFQGAPGEQWTMFFKDPSGNNLEFKAMTKPGNLFAKYNVADK